MDTVSPAEKAQKVKEFLAKSQLDPEVTKLTMGTQHSGITTKLLLESSTKLIKVMRHEEEEDDRDSLHFAQFHGLEDFVKEHIEKDQGKIQRKALFKIQGRRSLEPIHQGFFTPQIKSTVQGSQLSQAVDNSSPVDLLSVQGKFTRLGPGGIPDTNQVSDQARQVSPTTFGAIDSLQLVESSAIGVTQYLTQGTRKGDDGKLYKLLHNNKTGKNEWVDHMTWLTSKVGIPEH